MILTSIDDNDAESTDVWIMLGFEAKSSMADFINALTAKCGNLTLSEDPKGRTSASGLFIFLSSSTNARGRKLQYREQIGNVYMNLYISLNSRNRLITMISPYL